MSVQFRINQSGGRYIGQSQYLIAQEIWTNHHFVLNVFCAYNLTNSCYQQPKQHGCSVLTPNAIKCIEIEKLCKPSIYTAEILRRLVMNGIIHPTVLPHPSTIIKFLRNELMMTKQKIHTVLSKSKNEDIGEHAKLFPDQVSDLAVSSLHYFDETSVTKTTSSTDKSGPKGQGCPSSVTVRELWQFIQDMIDIQR